MIKVRVGADLPVQLTFSTASINDFSGGIMRRNLAVLVTQEHLPGFMTDAFGPQSATEGMFQIMYPHLR